jgi:diguanylate cyclase (GGDEF)-like protein
MYRKPVRLLLASIPRLLTPKGVIAGGVLLWFTVIALCCWISYQSYKDAVQLATQSSNNLLLVIERSFKQIISAYNLSLQAVVDGATDIEIMALPTRLRNRVLFDNSATGKYFGGMMLLDAEGRVIADTAHMDVPSMEDFSDRKSFLVHKNTPLLDFWISPSHHFSHLPGVTEITFSRRVSNSDGSFAGVVIGTMYTDYFQSLLEGLDLRRTGSAAVIMTDGTLLARNPYIQAMIGKNFRSGPIFQEMMREQSGALWGRIAIDGVERLHVFKRIEGLPILIAVSPSRNDILADWKRRAVLLGVLAFLFGLVVLPTSYLFARELQRRQKSELELRRQAYLDPLTGLDNRGTFDRALQKACAVAARIGSPLALLFFDVDKFKIYNDTYGHQAGDKVLKRVTAAASNELRRLTDHFARFGGEEFIAILEGADETQAATTAERVRAAIENLKIPHAGSSTGVVTVSVGIASVSGAITPEMIVKMADEALYDAKAAGRNCVMHFSPKDKAVSAVASIDC